MTDKYPDLVALVPYIRGDGVSSFILEGEVVAVDRSSGEPEDVPDSHESSKERCRHQHDPSGRLSLRFRSDVSERRAVARSVLQRTPSTSTKHVHRKRNHFTWVKSIDATSAESETVLEFFKSATDIKCEGIMVKVLDNLLNPDLLNGELDPQDDAPIAPPQPPTPSKPSKKPTQKVHHR